MHTMYHVVLNRTWQVANLPKMMVATCMTVFLISIEKYLPTFLRTSPVPMVVTSMSRLS